MFLECVQWSVLRWMDFILLGVVFKSIVWCINERMKFHGERRRESILLVKGANASVYL